MFFDALKPLCLKDLQAFYVFCPVFMDFRGDSASLNSGSTLPKGKVRPTQYLGKERRDRPRRCPWIKALRVGVR